MKWTWLLVVLLLTIPFLFPCAEATVTDKLFPTDDGTAGSYPWYPFPNDGIHYDKVDDDPHDSDTTYLSTLEDSANRFDRFLKDNVSLPEGATITNVYINATCKREYYAQPTNPSLRMGFYNGSASEVSSLISVTTDTYYEYSANWSLNPFTDNPWTADDIDALELELYGISSRKKVGFTWYYTLVLCTQYFFYVEYSSGNEFTVYGSATLRFSTNCEQSYVLHLRGVTTLKFITSVVVSAITEHNIVWMWCAGFLLLILAPLGYIAYRKMRG